MPGEILSPINANPGKFPRGCRAGPALREGILAASAERIPHAHHGRGQKGSLLENGRRSEWARPPLRGGEWQPKGDGGTEGESYPQCSRSRRMSFFSSCESQCRDSMYRVLRSGCGAEGKVSRQPERPLLASSRFPRVLSHR